MLPGWALTVEPDAIVIGSMCGVELVSRAPLALAFVKLTVPKFASGRTPPLLDGASAITSADASFADLSFAVFVFVQPRVVFEMVNVKLPRPSVVTDAVMVSPGRTVWLRLTGNFGYISYQA
jgi:hypothetical protein